MGLYSFCVVRKQKIEKTSKNRLKCMVLQLGQNITVFGRFLKFLLSNHPKTNIESYSTPKDSTLDTPQGGGFGQLFFDPILWAQETSKWWPSDWFQLLDNFFFISASK